MTLDGRGQKVQYCAKSFFLLFAFPLFYFILQQWKGSKVLLVTLLHICFSLFVFGYGVCDFLSTQAYTRP